MSGPLRVLVTGSRDWADRATVRRALDDLGFGHAIAPSPSLRGLKGGFEDGMVVVHGHCPTGADHWADEWVAHNTDLGVTVERHPADWDRHGKAAGPLRNQRMVDLGADICLAFIKGHSRGASMTAAAAEKAGIPTRRWVA